MTAAVLLTTLVSSAGADRPLLDQDIVVDVADDAEAVEQGRVQRAGAPQVIYSNFSDGTEVINDGPENAAKNSSSVCRKDLIYPAWEGDEKRKAIVQARFQAMLADFNVVLTAERPVDGPYTMIMIGPGAAECGIPFGGVAPLDCGNRNPSNVCFDFSATGSPIIMAQEVGHTFGLAHTDVACDVMGDGYSRKSCPSGEWGFPDETGLVIGGWLCGGSVQNSHWEMTRILGAWPGGSHPDPRDGKSCADGAPPSLVVKRPSAGDRLAREFVVEVDVADDCGPITRARLDLPGLGLSRTLDAGPWVWSLREIPESSALEIRVSAQDASGKEGAALLTVSVAGEASTPQANAGGCRYGGSLPARRSRGAMAFVAVGLVVLAVFRAFRRPYRH